MKKRTKFVINSVLLSGGFLALSLLAGEVRFGAIGFLALFTVVLFAWSLSDGLGKNATLLVLVLPALFTLGVGLFWFLLPASPLTRLPIVIIYSLGIYALSLTSNIFLVSTVRAIALSRAAKGVGFVMTLFTAFLIYDTILSARLAIWISPLLVALVTGPLVFQSLWTARLGQEVTGNMVTYSVIFSYSASLVALMLFFWPVSVIVGSLFLTAGMYVLLGLGQAKIENRLFRSTVREYLSVGIVIFIAMAAAADWRF